MRLVIHRRSHKVGPAASLCTCYYARSAQMRPSCLMERGGGGGEPTGKVMDLQSEPSDSPAMWSTPVLVAALLAMAAGVCHHLENDYYTEIGCKPAVTGEDGCPKSYDCSMISQRSPGKCHFRGKEYDEGHDLQQDDDCLAACRCRTTFPDNKLDFTCANVECAELFSGPPPPGCYRTYEHGKCCSVKEICISDQTTEQKSAKSVCQYKGQEYQVGMKFYPDEEPCLACICQPGFSGSLVEPYCKKVNCSLELHYGSDISAGCIPVYYGKTGCCPIGFRCPEKSDKVALVSVVKNDAKTSDSGLQCQFGDVRMQVGDQLSPSEEWANTQCECRVPPHPVCFQTN